MKYNFTREGLQQAMKEASRAHNLGARNNSEWDQESAPLLQPGQQSGTYPGEEWQLDFAQMPPCQGHKYPLVFTDTFKG